MLNDEGEVWVNVFRGGGAGMDELLDYPCRYFVNDCCDDENCVHDMRSRVGLFKLVHQLLSTIIPDGIIPLNLIIVIAYTLVQHSLRICALHAFAGRYVILVNVREIRQ